MDEEEDKNQNANGYRCISRFDEEHGGSRQKTAQEGSLPAEKLKARAKIRRGSNFEQETGQIHDEECHLQESQ